VVSKKDWVFFAKRTLLPQLGEDWVVLRSGHLARSGDDWMVQVAYYNPAAFPHEAKLLAFVVPLFVRSSSFNLNWHILSRQRFDWSAEDWMDGAAAWFSTEATHFWRDWGTTAGFMAQLDAKYFAPGPENWVSQPLVHGRLCAWSAPARACRVHRYHPSGRAGPTWTGTELTHATSPGLECRGPIRRNGIPGGRP